MTLLISNILNHISKTPHDKINKIVSNVPLVENVRRQWNLGSNTVTFGCRKWKYRYKILKFVILAENFEQQTDSSRCRKKIANQGDAPREEISRIHLFLSNKWKTCHGAINSLPHYLRTTLEKYFRFHWNCKILRV